MDSCSCTHTYKLDGGHCKRLQIFFDRWPSRNRLSYPLDLSPTDCAELESRVAAAHADSSKQSVLTACDSMKP